MAVATLEGKYFNTEVVSPGHVIKLVAVTNIIVVVIFSVAVIATVTFAAVSIVCVDIAEAVLDDDITVYNESAFDSIVMYTVISTASETPA